MKISDVLAITDEIKPSKFDDNLKINWLSELDAKVFNELIMTHEHDLVEIEGEDGEESQFIEPTYTGYDSEDCDLLIPDTYADVYRHWLYAMQDYANGEAERYAVSSLMFNERYKEYCNWYNSTHKPLGADVKYF